MGSLIRNSTLGHKTNIGFDCEIGKTYEIKKREYYQTLLEDPLPNASRYQNLLRNQSK